MERFSEEQLNKLDGSALVTLVMTLQEQLKVTNDANEALREQIEKLTEQVMLMNTRQYGRSSERALPSDDQFSIYDFGFNEAETLIQGELISEPDSDTVIIPEHKRRKRKGKRDQDLSGFPVNVIEHNLSDEELQEKFPDGYFRLPDEVYKKLERHPASYEVLEHHIAVYKGKNGEIAKATHPKEMLNNSIATPSLVSSIVTAKYVTGTPLYRQEQEYIRNGINISRQTMANWVITTAERYISLVYDRIKQEMLESHVLHADETPVTVLNDGRTGIHKSYMWVYRTGEKCNLPPMILYDYQKTRKADAPREFLSGFDGILETDGYQVYHTLEKEQDIRFRVAGCWIHARRPFAEVIKTLGKEKSKGTVAAEVYAKIEEILRKDRLLWKLPPAERKKRRKRDLEPLVDKFFKWLKEIQYKVPPQSATAKGINYCLNQETYLKGIPG